MSILQGSGVSTERVCLPAGLWIHEGLVRPIDTVDPWGAGIGGSPPPWEDAGRGGNGIHSGTLEHFCPS